MEFIRTDADLRAKIIHELVDLQMFTEKNLFIINMAAVLVCIK